MLSRKIHGIFYDQVMPTLIVIIFLLSSCDAVYNYTYQVTNKTNSEIEIELKTFQIDTIYTIEKNVTKILFVTDHGVERPKCPYYRDVSYDLKKFNVMKNDTIISSKNYLDSASWSFNNGIYNAIIEPDEFK